MNNFVIIIMKTGNEYYKMPNFQKFQKMWKYDFNDKFLMISTFFCI